MVIEVADAAGIGIPRFCYHKKLTVAANCRMCLVEVEKAPKPLPACATPVMEGMKVFTGSPTAKRAQRSVMEFLLINHPLDCPICDQGGECELQDVAMGYGGDVSRFVERKRVVPDPDLGPLIATEMTRCIHCTRCVRFGEEIAGMPELGGAGRGEDMKIGTYVQQSVDSELSGNVIDLCPVGALTSKPYRFNARAWEMRQRAGVAPHDAVGSNLNVHVARRRVMRVVPRENEAVNETWISDRDRFSYEGLYAADRLTTPRVKRGGEWVDADWTSALEHAAGRLAGVRDSRGAEAIGALASPSSTVEELYLLQRLMRGLGSANVDHRLRQSDFRGDAHAPPFPWLGVPIEALERQGAVLLVGANPRKEQPLLNHRLRKAALAGGRVMSINAMRHDANMPVGPVMVAGPGELAGSLAAVVAAGSGGKVPKALSALLSGASASDESRAIAEALDSAEDALVLLGSGALDHPDASTLLGLAALLGERTGARVGVLSAGANAAGAWLAGAVPHRAEGSRQVESPGLDAGAMLERGLAAYVLLAIEPEHDCASSAAALSAMQDAELVVALTAYATPAMEAYADVLLPVAGFVETSGTYVNAEGRWQSFDGAVAPPGEARPGWKVLRVLGNALELDGFDQLDSAEVLQAVKAAAGEARPASPSTRIAAEPRYAVSADAISRIGDVPLYAVDPLVRRSEPLQASADGRDRALRLAPALAERIGLETGASARVRQNGTAVSIDVVVDERVAQGCVRLPAAIPETVGLGPAYGEVVVERA
jgi:NADH-quinone oxidoreductase subunit G